MHNKSTCIQKDTVQHKSKENILKVIRKEKQIIYKEIVIGLPEYVATQKKSPETEL